MLALIIAAVSLHKKNELNEMKKLQSFLEEWD